MKLDNKIVAITGAGGVICSEFAKELAKSGAKVCLLDINEESIIKVANEIGENALAIKVFGSSLYKIKSTLSPFNSFKILAISDEVEPGSIIIFSKSSLLETGVVK